MRLIAVGRQHDGPEAALVARYQARLRPALLLSEIAEARGAPAEIKRREAAALLGALPDAAFAVALDSGGDAPDSARLAGLLERWLGSGRPVQVSTRRGRRHESAVHRSRKSSRASETDWPTKNSSMNYRGSGLKYNREIPRH